MQASQTKLQDIIEGTKQYVVPMFQRPYSWQKSEWELLWDDLMELYHSEEPYPHFMGSIVTMQTEDSVPEGVTKYLLIDGQQRLTTIMLLLAVLRDQAKQLEKMMIAEEINNRFLINTYSQGSDHYRLQPTQIDRHIFYHLINPESNFSSNNQSIYNCYLFFEKKVRTTKKIDISRLKEIICKDILLVRILLGKDDNPYLVFESLNAKGRPLTQGDLIRNYFFMQINPDQQIIIYKQYWLPMEKLLGENLTEFIRLYLTKSGVIVNKNEVYLKIKDRINRGHTLSYLQELYKFAKYYAIFLNPDLENNVKIRKYLTRINRLDVSTVYPFLLNCYHDWQQNKIIDDDLIKIFKVIENYLLRRFVCNVQTRGLNRIFATLYSQVTKQANLAEESFLEKLKLVLQTQNYPKDSEFKARLMDVKLYGSNRTDKARLILESLEESFQHKEKVSYDNLTIEHIMPQTLNDWWKNHLGEDYELTHELLIHSLGNLTLTAYNPELSNAEFTIKKEQLNNSHLELNKYFNNLDSWQREDMEKRANILAERALKIWAYFGDDSVKFTDKNDVTGTRPTLLRMFNEEYSVKSWRDVLETSLNILAESEPEKFNDIMTQFPRFLGKDQQDFKVARQLKNGVFIEVQLSAKDIYTFCQKAIETAELTSEDWSIETI